MITTKQAYVGFNATDITTYLTKTAVGKTTHLDISGSNPGMGIPTMGLNKTGGDKI